MLLKQMRSSLHWKPNGGTARKSRTSARLRTWSTNAAQEETMRARTRSLGACQRRKARVVGPLSLPLCRVTQPAPLPSPRPHKTATPTSTLAARLRLRLRQVHVGGPAREWRGGPWRAGCKCEAIRQTQAAGAPNFARGIGERACTCLVAWPRLRSLTHPTPSNMYGFPVWLLTLQIRVMSAWQFRAGLVMFLPQFPRA